MAAPVITTPAPSRTASGLTALAVAATIIILTAIAIVGVVAWSPWAARDASGVVVQFGAGYPVHGGLAGPSRVAPLSALDVAVGFYGAGYPLHGGLAGPSRIGAMSAVDVQYGAGYPLHGGLAGPSRAGD